MKGQYFRSSPRKLPLRSYIVLGLTTLGCIFGVNFYMSALEAQIVEKGCYLPVVIAARNLEPGRLLQKGDFTLTQIPESACLKGGYSDINDKDLAGKYVTAFMQEGEQITNRKIGKDSSAPTTAGKRWYQLKAVSMAISNVLRQGDKVDIIGVVDGPDGSLQSSPIVQNVVVSALSEGGSDLYGLEGKSGAVIVEVTLKEAQRIALAEALGTISLVKRSESDSHREQTTSVTEADLTANTDFVQKPVYQRFELVFGVESQLQYLPAVGREKK